MNNRIRALRYAIPVLLAASGLTRCAPADSFGYAATAQPAPYGYGYDSNGYDPGYQPYYANPGYPGPDYQGDVFLGFGGERDWHEHGDYRDNRWPQRGPGAAPLPPPTPGAFRPPPVAPQRAMPLSAQPMPQHPSFAAPAPPPRLGSAPPVQPRRPGEL